MKRLPKVLQQLATEHLLTDFTMFFRMVSEGRYPLNNIAFLLWLDTVKWHGLRSTTNMTYGKKTMTFWHIGYMLFHGKFLRLMSGKRNLGQLVTERTTRGSYDPSEGSINFAVPLPEYIRHFQPSNDLDSVIEPGIISPTLNVVAASSSAMEPHIVQTDAKKMASGLEPDSGDIDLFGHEKGEKLQDRKSRHSEEDEYILVTKDIFKRYGDDMNTHPSPIPTVLRVQKIILFTSNGMRDLRKREVSQNFSFEKYKKMAGANWFSEKNRYNFTISNITREILRIQNDIQRGLKTVGWLTRLLCRAQRHKTFMIIGII